MVVKRSLLHMHPLVITLLIGTLFVNIALSMSGPYFAIYLSQNTHMAIASIGLILGSRSIAGTLGGFIGGVMSDRFGRSRVLVFSLLVLAFTNLGYVLSSNPVVILLLILFNGFFGSFFGPTSKALMADVTRTDMLVHIFSRQYVATNIGYALGPLLGVALGFLGGPIPFVITSSVYTLYVCVLGLLLARTFGSGRIQSSTNHRSIRDVFGVLKSDSVLFIFVLGGLITTLVQGQWSTPMSVFLTHNRSHGATTFSFLLTTNALVVIVFQPLFSRLMGKLEPIQNIIIGGLLFAMGCVVFSIAASGTSYIIGMVVFTFGEIFLVPAEYTIIDSITPQDMRGAYYGAVSLTGLGSFLGPWCFSMVLADFNGVVMFLSMGGFALLSILIYTLGVRRQRGFGKAALSPTSTELSRS